MQFNQDIIDLAKKNTNFRQVLVTGKNSQLVLMSIPPKGEIGKEVHQVDQVLCFVEGEGEAVLDDEVSSVIPGFVTFVPAGTWHNFYNTGETDLKLYTIYAPPQHADGTVHKTKADAEKAE